MQRETYAHVQVGTPAPKWCTKIALNHLVLAVGLGPGAEQDRKVRGRNGGGARPVGHGLQLQPLWTNPAAAVSHSHLHPKSEVIRPVVSGRRKAGARREAAAQRAGGLTAATPVENPHCSCRLSLRVGPLPPASGCPLCSVLTLNILPPAPPRPARSCPYAEPLLQL